MKDFLNRILEDSYNFNKLDRVLELKLIDIQEKYENQQKVEDLLIYNKELMTIRTLLLDENLCKVYKSCKIFSFLLSYAFIHHRSVTGQTPRSNVDGKGVYGEDVHISSKLPKENREHLSSEHGNKNREEWHKLIGDFVNTVLESSTSNIDNNLINSHLVNLLHDLTLYLTHPQFTRTYKSYVNSVYNGVIKLVNSLSSNIKVTKIIDKLNEIILTILKHYHSTNQIQNEHITQLERLCNSPSDRFKEYTVGVSNSDNKYGFNKEKTHLLKASYDLMLKINKNYLLTRFDRLENVDIDFLVYMLRVIGNDSSSGHTKINIGDLNLLNVYKLVIKLINGLSTITNTTTSTGTNTQISNNNMETSHKTLQLFELLQGVIALLNKDLFLVHLNKIVEVINLLFQTRFILLNYSGLLLELVTTINTHCPNFGSLINYHLLTHVVNTHTNTGNKDNKEVVGKFVEIPVDTLKLYAYLIDNHELESLIHEYMYNGRVNSVLFDQYLSNVLNNNRSVERSLLLNIYSVVRDTENIILMNKLKYLLSH